LQRYVDRHAAAVAGVGRVPHPLQVGGQQRPILDAEDSPALASAPVWLPVDFAANAANLGARMVRVETIDKLRSALANRAQEEGPVVICVEVERYASVPDFEGWCEVPVAEVSEDSHVQKARAEYKRA
jgi:TPP-dependent trihydroxycyclohexane-1,2-dione (THcHDO) dehydratase